MMNTHSILKKLIEKHSRPIEEQLNEAIESGKVKSQYVPFESKGRNETITTFATRLVEEALQYQFVHVAFNGQSHYVAFGASGPIISAVGRFNLIPASVVGGHWGVHNFLFYPSCSETLRRREIFIRLDSGCNSGQMFGDMTCDCRQQFDIALKSCIEEKCGVVIHIPAHDGRGWSLFKMANQQLMDEGGIDTVEAAKLFYGNEENIDQRGYTEAVVILRAFGFGNQHSFKLATNNPRKIGAFTGLGMNLTSTYPVIARELNKILEENLRAKSKQWGHTIPIENRENKFVFQGRIHKRHK